MKRVIKKLVGCATPLPIDKPRAPSCFVFVVLTLSSVACVGQLPAFNEHTGAAWPFGRWVQVEADRPSPLAQRYLGECTYAGSVDHIDRLPVIGKIAQTEVFLLYASFSEIQIPHGGQQDLHGKLSYPIVADVLVSPKSLGLFAATQKIHYVPGYVWQKAGRPFELHERRGERLLVRPPQRFFPPDREPLDSRYQTDVPCEKVQLWDEALEPPHGAPGLAKQVQLYDAPDGEVMAVVGASGDPVARGSRRGGWIEVKGLDEELVYRGWIRAEDVKPESASPTYTIDERVANPTHKAIEDTPLSFSYRMTDMGIVLPKGSRVYVAETRQGVSRVFVPHIRVPRLGAFFMRADKLVPLKKSAL